jgi:capsular polysaccharide transport system ATP-binding protein
MIRLSSVTKTYHLPGGRTKSVLSDVTAEFPTGHNVGIFGLNGAGKSTLIRLLAGAEQPDRGEVVRDGLISFPLGFDTVFHPNLTGRENAKFIARIYGRPVGEILDYVDDFAELGPDLDVDIGNYSSGMRSKYSFGVCLALAFDVYLIDEITEVGDARFRLKALQAFRERAAQSDVIIVSHNIDTIRAYCDMGAVLHNGALTFFNDLDSTIRHFRTHL